MLLSGREILARTFRTLEGYYSREPCSTGVTQLDDAIVGWRPGMLTVIEGDRFARLASDLLLHLALSHLMRRGIVAYYALDLSSENVMLQILSLSAELRAEAVIEDGERAWPTFIKAAVSIFELPLYMNGDYEVTPAMIEEECSRILAVEREPIIFIDSIHGLATEADPHATAVMEELAIIAQRRRFTIIATAHTGRLAREAREAANIVLETSLEEAEQDSDFRWPREAVIEVAKNDFGPKTRFSLEYDVDARAFDGFRWSQASRAALHRGTKRAE